MVFADGSVAASAVASITTPSASCSTDSAAGNDPIIAEAVLTAHPAASGLCAADLEKVRTRYLTIHPDAAALDRLKEMIAAVTSALAMAKSEMDDSLGADLPVVAA